MINFQFSILFLGFRFNIDNDLVKHAWGSLHGYMQTCLAASVIFFSVSVFSEGISYYESQYRQSTNLLRDRIYHDRPVAFYSGCSYTKDFIDSGLRLRPSWKTCRFSPRKSSTKSWRASRIEWEHVVPVYRFVHLMPCLKSGGRESCRLYKLFNSIESDMHNLVPSIGQINADRSNFRFAILPGEKRLYGRVDFEVDFKARIVEPRPSIRGDIARIYFYMSDKYRLPLSDRESLLFIAWSQSDPVSDWEILKNRRVYRFQGNYNPYISDPDAR